MKHGMTGTRTYISYIKMLDRCYNENEYNYYKYGGKGIKVCDRWRHSFINFYEDMGERPEETTLDRIDSELNYTPDNCRWADKYTQSRNRSNVRRRRERDFMILEHIEMGETVSDISETLGIKKYFIYGAVSRKKHGKL